MHQRGQDYPLETIALQAAPDAATHGINTTYVINPDRIWQQALNLSPKLAEKTLVVDVLRHKELVRSVIAAPDHLRTHFINHLSRDNQRANRIIQAVRLSQPKCFHFNAQDNTYDGTIVIPYFLSGNINDSRIAGPALSPLLSTPTRLSPVQQICQSAIICSHELGHVAERVENLHKDNVNAIVVDADRQTLRHTFQSQAIFGNFNNRMGAEMYADAFSLTLCQKMLPARHFIDAALLLMDCRSIATMGKLVSDRKDAPPEIIYLNAPIIQNIVQQVGVDNTETKTPKQHVQDARISISEVVELHQLYQGMGEEGLCSDPNTFITELGNRGGRAQTRYGAILARDFLSAMERFSPNGVYDRDIMSEARRKISDSPGGRRYFRDFRDPYVISVGAHSRIRKIEQARMDNTLHTDRNNPKPPGP